MEFFNCYLINAGIKTIGKLNENRYFLLKKFDRKLAPENKGNILQDSYSRSSSLFMRTCEKVGLCVSPEGILPDLLSSQDTQNIRPFLYEI